MGSGLPEVERHHCGRQLPVAEHIREFGQVTREQSLLVFRRSSRVSHNQREEGMSTLSGLHDTLRVVPVQEDALWAEECSSMLFKIYRFVSTETSKSYGNGVLG